eukprot:TRINITY_DN33613_c0_g1_i1.p1 TRINITY_DN33613_c0_g1~~TRINITY_DN33613_c0_g1_i1.p1  ORF type:complete len:121 (+),score=1.77 TRINITY_DN33613_c0_g1_i1:81-443(+)
MSDLLRTSLRHISHVQIADPSDKEAVALMLRLAVTMDAVLGKYGWKIGKLVETRNPKILGVNKCHGKVVKIRLRNVRGSGFRTWEQILGTAMHEIAHITIDSHSDDRFVPLITNLKRHSQ